MYTEFKYRSDVLAHSGIKGMKWGVRRYQNKDGSLTAAGKKRYARDQQRALNRYEKTLARNIAKSASLKRYLTKTEGRYEKKYNRYLSKNPNKAERYANKRARVTNRFDRRARDNTALLKKRNALFDKLRSDPNYAAAVRRRLIPIKTTRIRDIFKNSPRDLIRDNYYNRVTANKYKVRYRNPNKPNKYKNYKYYWKKQDIMPLRILDENK